MELAEPEEKLLPLVREIAVVGTAFLLGVLGAFEIEAVGRLRLNEALLVLLVPFIVYRLIRSRSIRQYRVVLILGALYLAGQIGSDLYRNSASQDFLRGWVRIGIMLLGFIAAALWFVRNRNAMLAIMLGTAFIGPIRFYIEGDVGDEDLAYKMSLGTTVSLGAFLFVCVAPKALRVPAAIAPLLAAVLALIRGGRNLFGITLLALITYWIGRLRLFRRRRISRRRIVITVGVIILSIWGVLQVYRYAASTGALGEGALDKFESQTQRISTGSVGTLLGGRQELIFSLPKIMASPLIGYGSWAKDLDYVWNRANEVGLDPEEFVEATKGELGLIPTHSRFFGGWLEAGLAGALFWGFALFMAIDVLIRQKFIRHPEFAPVINFFLVYFVWDVFFSPYGGDRRVWDGVIIAWTASIYYKNKRSRAAKSGAGEDR